jgi:DNA-directed RNA polymerase specialized sigma24 family protein
MTPPAQNKVTQQLLAWSDGDKAALEELTTLVYTELRRLAERYLRRERPGHPLQTTALVNEAYVRLVDLRQMRWQNRAHFFGGLSVEETAEALNVSPRTVQREWNMARDWLYRELSKGKKSGRDDP